MSQDTSTLLYDYKSTNTDAEGGSGRHGRCSSTTSLTAAATHTHSWRHSRIASRCSSPTSLLRSRRSRRRCSRTLAGIARTRRGRRPTTQATRVGQAAGGARRRSFRLSTCSRGIRQQQVYSNCLLYEYKSTNKTYQCISTNTQATGAPIACFTSTKKCRYWRN
jgi:hypothetical protein